MLLRRLPVGSHSGINNLGMHGQCFLLNVLPWNRIQYPLIAVSVKIFLNFLILYAVKL